MGFASGWCFFTNHDNAIKRMVGEKTPTTVSKQQSIINNGSPDYTSCSDSDADAGGSDSKE